MHTVDLFASTKIATTWMPVVNDTDILGFRENQHFSGRNLDKVLHVWTQSLFIGEAN